MSESEVVPTKPDLSQFEPDRQVFGTEQARMEYVAAFEVFRQAARDAGVQRVHVRLLGQPTPALLGSLAKHFGCLPSTSTGTAT